MSLVAAHAGMMALGGGGPGPDPGDTDPYFAYVTSLVHFDSPVDGTTTPDVARPNTPWAIRPQPFGGGGVQVGAARFGAAGLDTLTQASAYSTQGTWFQFDALDFTIEAFFFPKKLSDYGNVVNSRPDGNGETGICIRHTNDGKAQAFWGGGAYNIVGQNAITPNVWHHIALVRQGTAWRLFLDGISQGDYVMGTTPLTPVRETNVWLGQYGAFADGREHMDGYIDEFRVTKGVARYWENFTPPSAPFPNS